MKVQAFLCDAATVREGLLHVLGGGITRLWREQVPAAIGCDLAVMLTMHVLETEDRHLLRVRIMSADGTPIANLDAEFGVEGSDETSGPQARKPGESLLFPVSLPLRNVAVPSHGEYSIEILVDGHHAESLFFLVAPPVAQAED